MKAQCDKHGCNELLCGCSVECLNDKPKRKAGRPRLNSVDSKNFTIAISDAERELIEKSYKNVQSFFKESFRKMLLEQIEK